MKLLSVLLISAALLISQAAGRSSGARVSTARAPATSHAASSPARATTAPHVSSTRCASCARDTRGRIERSAAPKRDFQRTNPCPSTGRASGGCSGYVVDHVTPLKRGGPDAASNMQWQTKAAAKAKDRTE